MTEFCWVIVLGIEVQSKILAVDTFSGHEEESVLSFFCGVISASLIKMQKNLF
jgi:hypothetical protein